MISQFNYVEEGPEGSTEHSQITLGSLWVIASVGNRLWDPAPSAHLVVLHDGGRIDLTTPRIRGTGSLGRGVFRLPDHTVSRA